MKNKDMHVKMVNNNWGVVLNQVNSNGENPFIRMQSKADAVRYARICEQRTGVKVLISK